MNAVMRISFDGGDISGTISPPPSKSHTHRAFFLASMAEGVSNIGNPLMSADTVATLNAMRAMGAVARIGDGVEIRGGNLHSPDGEIDVGNSGTTIRILTAVASLLDSPVTITGDESIRKRPMGPLLDALVPLGVESSSEDGRPPVTIKGKNRGGKTSVDGSASSQFLSALLLAAPLAENDTEITVSGKLVSEPYVEITSSMMGRFGVDVTYSEGGFRIPAKGYSPCDYTVPTDFSSAAFPLVAGALGGEITVRGLDLSDQQGDKAILDILAEAGAVVSVSGAEVTVKKGKLKAIEADLGKTSDLFPIVSVLLSVAEGESTLYGAPHLRFKETDRIESTVSMLRAIGADAGATEDGCIIKGRRSLKGGYVEHGNDHRIMMAAAVASIICEKRVTMEDTGCHEVSYPDFPYEMARIGMVVEGGAK